MISAVVFGVLAGLKAAYWTQVTVRMGRRPFGVCAGAFTVIGAVLTAAAMGLFGADLILVVVAVFAFFVTYLAGLVAADVLFALRP